jgi:hypothetical protein
MNCLALRRVGAVRTDYAGGVKKRNQSGTDYVQKVQFFNLTESPPDIGRNGTMD